MEKDNIDGMMDHLILVNLLKIKNMVKDTISRLNKVLEVNGSMIRLNKQDI